MARKLPTYRSFNNDFDALFNKFFDFDSTYMPLSYRSNTSHVDSIPKANVYKTSDGYSVELAVPGYSRDEFDMSVENGVLSVSLNGSVEDGSEEQNSIRRREWSYSSFTRSFTLPEQANIDQITARYDAGILKVAIPVEEPSTSRRQITVE